MNKSELLSLQNLYTNKNADLVDEIFDYMDLLLVEDIEKSLMKSGLSFGTARKIYKAETWVEIQSKIDKLVESNLGDIFKNYKKSIDSLVAFYDIPFFIKDVERDWDIFAEALKDASNLKDIAMGTKYETEILLKSNQALIVTENSRRVIEYTQQKIQKTISQTKTLLNTMQNNTFNNQRQQFFAKVPTEKEKHYEYVGPVDKLTRPICRKYVGKKKTEAQWRKISNQQVGNMWNYKGGYNCRHFFLLVPERL